MHDSKSDVALKSGFGTVVYAPQVDCKSAYAFIYFHTAMNKCFSSHFNSSDSFTSMNGYASDLFLGFVCVSRGCI